MVALRDATRETLEEHTRQLVGCACQRVEKFMNRILDNLFLHGLRTVNQMREALANRDRLRNYAAQVTELHTNLRGANQALLDYIVQ